MKEMLWIYRFWRGYFKLVKGLEMIFLCFMNFDSWLNLFFRGLELYVLFYVEKMLILFICKILYVILLKIIFWCLFVISLFMLKGLR